MGTPESDEHAPHPLDLQGMRSDLSELMAVAHRIDALAFENEVLVSGKPNGDLLDISDRWQLRLEVPGVELDDLEIALQGDQLRVAGVRRPLEEGVSAIYRERGDGPFERSFTLPGPVRSEAVAAHLRSGLLIVDLPKLDRDEA